MLRLLSKMKSAIRSMAWGLCSGHVSAGGKRLARLKVIPNVLTRSVKHEPFLTDIFGVALQLKQGAVIDVGVNIGQTLLRMLELVPERPYIGFEPQPLPAACVEIFLRQNNLHHHKILPVALSDSNGPLSIKMRGTGIQGLAPGTASMVAGFRPESFYDQEALIFAVRGDDVLRALGVQEIALIKVDVEGAELEVLRGLTQTLVSCRPIVVFEVLHHYLVATDSHLDDNVIAERERRILSLENHLREAQYKILHIEGTAAVKEVQRIQPKRVNDLSSTDYVAVPVEDFGRYIADLQRFRGVVATVGSPSLS